MIIKVKVISSSRHPEIKKLENGTFIVKVKEKALEGKANQAVINALSAYFKVKKQDISFLRGLKLKNKLIEINLK